MEDMAGGPVHKIIKSRGFLSRVGVINDPGQKVPFNGSLPLI